MAAPGVLGLFTSSRTWAVCQSLCPETWDRDEMRVHFPHLKTRPQFHFAHQGREDTTVSGGFGAFLRSDFKGPRGALTRVCQAAAW